MPDREAPGPSRGRRNRGIAFLPEPGEGCGHFCPLESRPPDRYGSVAKAAVRPGAGPREFSSKRLVAPCIFDCSDCLARYERWILWFSGEAARALRLGPWILDRPPAFFANTVEYHRPESLYHKLGLARLQGRENRRVSAVREPP